MKFGFIAKHRAIWPIKWLCEALGVSRSGFHAWLTRSPSRRAREDEALLPRVRSSFLDSDRTYGARRVWHDLLGGRRLVWPGHRVERLMRVQALRARPRRRGLPADNGERKAKAIAPNLLDRQFEAEASNKKWVADFTYIWTAEGWLYVSAVIDLFSRRVVGWSMKEERRRNPSRTLSSWQYGVEERPMRCCIIPLAAASTLTSSSSDCSSTPVSLVQ